MRVVCVRDNVLLCFVPDKIEKTMRIPKGIETIEEEAISDQWVVQLHPDEERGGWYSTENVKKVILPATIKEIKEGPISGFMNIEKIQVEEGCTGGILKDGCLCSPDGKTLLFYPMGGKRKIVIPEGIKRIGNLALFGHYQLDEVIIPEGVEEIGKQNLIVNYKLAGEEVIVHLPGSLKKIGSNSFTSIYYSFSTHRYRIVAPEGSYAIKYAMRRKLPYTEI